MKKKIAICLLILLTYKISSQDLKIEVDYIQGSQNKRFTKSDEVKFFKGLNYTLTATNYESIFIFNESLNSEENMRYAVPSIFYTNIKSNTKLESFNFFGGDYLVSDAFNTLNWKLNKNTKIIGSYTCYQATAHIKEKRLNGKEDFEYDVIAWYTPDIAIPFGPLNYEGLPGLILEINSNNRIFIAEKIRFIKEKEIKKISKPTIGKQMSRENFLIELNKISKKYSK
jgi:GLPGLI family protein